MEGKEMRESTAGDFLGYPVTMPLDIWNNPNETRRPPSRDQEPEYSEEDTVVTQARFGLRCLETSGCLITLLPREDNHLPWLYGFDSSLSTTRTFVNISTKRSYVLCVPYFYQARLLYSKKGWLLFQSDLDTGTPCSLFLFNPFTGERLDLPGLDFRIRTRHAAFSTTSSGTPYIVAILHDTKPCISVAHPDERTWSDHTYLYLNAISDVVVYREQVMCFTNYGSLLILDLRTDRWACFAASGEDGAYQRVDEPEVLALGWEPLRRLSRLPFAFPTLGTEPVEMADARWCRATRRACRLLLASRDPDKRKLEFQVGVTVEDLATGGEAYESKPLRLLRQLSPPMEGGAVLMKMEESELECRDWFLGKPGPCYLAKGEGNKVYRLERFYVCRDKTCLLDNWEMEFVVTVQDFAGDTTSSELLPSPITGVSEVHWVDLRLTS